MNAETLIQHFDALSEAPDAVPRLRRFVVDLAISGKLTISADGDVTPEELLSMLRAARENAVAKPVKSRPISRDELPVDLPDGALFARLSEVAQVIKGATGIQNAKPGSYPLVALSDGRGSSDSYQFDTAAAIVPLISSTGHGHASIKRLHYQEGKFALGNILCAVIPYLPELLSARFVYEYLTAYKDQLLVAQMIGTANVSLTLGKVGDVPLPIVPPSAQARVNELMSLCDELEAVQKQREARHEAMVVATLRQLTIQSVDEQSDNHSSIEASVRFCLSQISRLTSKPEYIKLFRRTILDLAVSGRLVKQYPQEDSPTQLLAHIAEEKAEQVQMGRLKASKPQSRAGDTSVFHLPQGWCWARTDELFLSVTDGDHQAPPKVDSGIPFLVIGDVSSGEIRFDDSRFVPQDYFESLDWSRRPEQGDLLYTVTGYSLGLPILVKADRPFCVQRHMAILKTSRKACTDFLRMVMASPWYYMLASGIATGTAQKTVPLTGLRSLPIPVPPLSEQLRIVERVNEIFAICDRLHDVALTSASRRRKLLEAMLAGALADAPLPERTPAQQIEIALA
jgi:type I restriction enzyme S subunit